MDRLSLAQPLADRVPISLPELRAQVLPQRNVAEIRGDAVSLLQQYSGLLPSSPNRSVDHGTWRAVWLRPDGWLLIDTAENYGVSPAFWAAAAAASARVTDVSHSLVGIALSGTAVRRVLAQGTSLDLRASRFGPGQCARTWCAGFSLLLDHTHNHLDIYVDATAAPAFWTWLNDAVLTLVNAR